MKLFVSGNYSEYFELLSNYNLVSDINVADIVLILPGGLGCFRDLFNAINDNKKIILYNKDFFYTPVIKKLFELHEKKLEKRIPAEYMNIESDFLEIIKKLEENK